MAGRRYSVLIADDHLLMAEGIARLLEPEYDVIGIAGNGPAAVEETCRLLPDIVCLDISMPGLNGIQVAVQLHERVPRAKVVIVTQQLELPYLRAAFRAGAVGYVAKQSAAVELVTALRAALLGKSYITSLLTEAAAGMRNELVPDLRQVNTDTLTVRQREVLTLVSEGRTSKEIGTALHISPKTVEFHKQALMNEIGVRTTAELTRYAVAHQIVSTL